MEIVGRVNSFAEVISQYLFFWWHQRIYCPPLKILWHMLATSTEKISTQMLANDETVNQQFLSKLFLSNKKKSFLPFDKIDKMQLSGSVLVTSNSKKWKQKFILLKFSSTDLQSNAITICKCCFLAR